MNIPVQIKAMVPGYRARWRRSYACMMTEIGRLAPRLAFGEDDDVPWIEIDGGPRLFGFRTEPANAEVYFLLRRDLPAELPLSHFRLVKDCLTRYAYPHMRPDLKPEGFPVEEMFGFHAQQKDAIADLDDAAARARLTAAFRVGPDDVIIDCGAFLGFGELRLAPEAPRGRFLAVEADRDCHALLSRNLEYNGAANVTAIHRAVWNDEVELELETGFAQANTLVAEVQKGEATQKVRTVTVDGLVRAQGLDRLDMLSLTLNGAEVEALEGAGQALDELRPRIRLAGWYSRGGRKIWEITKAQLEAHRYDVYVGRRGNVMALPSEYRAEAP